MAVQFATDPGTDVFLRGLDAGERARKARTAIAVDAAIRRGIGAAGTSPDAALPAPALAPPIAVPGQAAPPPPASQPAAIPSPPPMPPGDPAQVGVSGGVPDSVPAGAEPGSVSIQPPSVSVQPTPAARPTAALAPMLGRVPAAPSAPIAALSPPVGAPPQRNGGDRYGAVLQELAGVEGGGQAALGVMQQQDRAAVMMDRRRDQLARMSMYALAKGDVATGQYFAQQAGIPLPQIAPGRGRGGGRAGADPQVQQYRLIGQAALIARRLFGSDVQQAQRFTAAYVQNGGDLAAALDAVGPPTAGPVAQYRWVQHPDGGEALIGLRRDGSSLAMTDDDGQPMRRQPTMRVVPTQGGYASVNPGDGTAAPVLGPDGQPIDRPQPALAPRILRSGEGYASVGRDGTAETVLGADGQPIPGPPQRPQPTPRQPNPQLRPTPGGYISVGPDGAARPVLLPDGAPAMPLSSQGAARGGVRPLDREVKRDMLIQAGVDPQTANLAAAGGSLPPAARAQIYMRIQAAVNGDMMRSDQPQAEKDAEIARRFQAITSLFGGGAPAPAALAPPIALPRAQADVPAQAPAAAAPRSAAPAGPPPRPATVPPGSAYSAARRMWRTPEGRLFTEDGRPVQ